MAIRIECGWRKSGSGVALIALVEIGRGGELLMMRIGMTLGALQFICLKLCVTVLRRVTLLAGHRRVLTVKLKRRELVMILCE